MKPTATTPPGDKFAPISRPSIARLVILIGLKGPVQVTAHTEHGFKYAGAMPISIPRLGMQGDGTGEHFCDTVVGPGWEYAYPTPKERMPQLPESALPTLAEVANFLELQAHYQNSVTEHNWVKTLAQAVTRAEAEIVRWKRIAVDADGCRETAEARVRELEQAFRDQGFTSKQLVKENQLLRSKVAAWENTLT